MNIALAPVRQLAPWLAGPVRSAMPLLLETGLTAAGGRAETPRLKSEWADKEAGRAAPPHYFSRGEMRYDRSTDAAF